MTLFVRASSVRAYAAVMRGLGADPAPFLRRYHIAPKAFEDDDALVDLRAVNLLLEASSAETGCGDLGLRIAETLDFGFLGALGVVIQNAATAAEAFQIASQYMFVHSQGLKLTMNPHSPLVEGAVEMVFDILLPGHPPQRQNIDMCLGTAHFLAKALLGAPYDLKLVTLPHTPIAPLSRYRRFFGAPVIASQERASLHGPVTAFGAELRGANPALRRITEDYLARHFRVPGDGVSPRVRLALRRVLGTPQASMEGIAAMLAIHPRTLHRRLEAEGTGFEAIKETLRQELALQYLRETNVPLGQISGLLGFPEQSAFSRSCRRWFDETPSAIRKKTGRAHPTRVEG
ncbi:AraC family transcriptional regulator [Oleomonas cavernae]|uniref:AraC family transcriptional regulator n=1 Tax=Oleomonas cavernae TaxID=2320859 RepID=A0A418VUF5_9PROT|nr:AraC family transcriptional regulator [Oleomonas cavernae]RJF80791.1 AraC family transcriptional regulator [Oleomonas cavernae]